MREFMNITKALSDKNRVRVLMFLGDGELCVCQIIEMLGLAPSTVSKHLSVLQQAGLIESRKDGRWVYYRLPGNGASPCVVGALNWVRRGLQGDALVVADARSLRKVQKRKKEDVSDCCYKS